MGCPISSTITARLAIMYKISTEVKALEKLISRGRRPRKIIFPMPTPRLLICHNAGPSKSMLAYTFTRLCCTRLFSPTMLLQTPIPTPSVRTCRCTCVSARQVDNETHFVSDTCAPCQRSVILYVYTWYFLKCTKFSSTSKPVCGIL